ncbi:hypothetical protein [Dongia sedimenti]|uniref:Uncharacterized protein n=1 Tax=Dongia sedimenti TaxID=3064282 RepID=A0ABU0YR87_9PROT|nr:hypothetical protein [Rhodospirillaceae bacterium R-7]
MVDPKSHTASPTGSKYAVWAILLMVFGWLLAITTGLCGGTFVISGLTDHSGYGEAVVMAGLIMGGIPCLVGVGLILAARKWGRRRAPSPTNPDVFA